MLCALRHILKVDEDVLVLMSYSIKYADNHNASQKDRLFLEVIDEKLKKML